MSGLGAPEPAEKRTISALHRLFTEIEHIIHSHCQESNLDLALSRTHEVWISRARAWPKDMICPRESQGISVKLRRISRRDSSYMISQRVLSIHGRVPASVGAGAAVSVLYMRFCSSILAGSRSCTNCICSFASRPATGRIILPSFVTVRYRREAPCVHVCKQTSS